MTKNELVQGTVMFWSTVDVSMDNRAKKWIGNVRGWSNANIWVGGVPFDLSELTEAEAQIFMANSIVDSKICFLLSDRAVTR